MSIRLHLVLMIASEFLAFFAGVGVCGWLFVTGRLGTNLLLLAPIAMAVLIAAVSVPRTLFRHFLAARCAQEECRGRSLPRGSDPIVYVCTKCGDKRETSILENTSPTSTDRNV